MKKLVLLFFSFLLYASGMYAAVTQSAAMEKAYNYVKGSLPSEYTFMYYPTKTRTIEMAGNRKISLSEDCWCFFVDKAPKANWGHPCIYIYVTASTGKVKSTIKYIPPKGMKNWKSSSYTKIENNVVNKSATNKVSQQSYTDENGLVLPNLYSSVTAGSRVTKDRKGKSYAVIISGGANADNNHVRYWNDCSILYQILRRLYSIPRENIYVYMSDGFDTAHDLHLGTNPETFYKPEDYIDSPTDLDADGNDDISGDASFNSLNNCFSQLKNTLKEEDHLYIFTTDHGSCDDAGVGNGLYLWDFNILTMSDFATMLKGIKAPIDIVMEQCYSGCFIHPIEELGQKITIATAAHRKETSVGYTYYNPFAYKWACAISGYDFINKKTVNADTDDDGEITMVEAFQYSKDAHPDDVAQYWSFGGVDYGEETVDVFSENSSYWLVVGQLGNYQTVDETVGCDYRCGRSRAPAKCLNLTTTISNMGQNDYYTYMAGHNLTANCKITNSKIRLQAYDKIILKKGFRVSQSDSKFKADKLVCTSSSTRSGELQQDEFEYEYVNREQIEYVNMDEDPLAESDMQLYPNPSDGVVSIAFENMDGEKHLSVINARGEIVYKNTYEEEYAELNLSNLVHGVYFVQVVSQNNTLMKKLILR